MIRFLRRLLLLAIGVVLIAVIVANRHTASMALDPLARNAPATVIEAPMFVFLFAALLIGFFLGGIGAWMGQSKWRNLARQRTKESHRLRQDRERLAQELQATHTQDARTLGRLPAR